MSETLSPKSLTLAALIVLGVAVVATAAGGLFEAYEHSASRTIALRRQLETVAKDSVEKRLAFDLALTQYETDSRIKIWTAVIQAAGGAAVLGGLVFTARNLRATQDKLDIDRQGQFANRLTQAVDQIGAERKDGAHNVEVRMGGIYAFHRLAKDTPDEYWAIADILTAYVRHVSKWDDERANPPRPAADIQAIVRILGRYPPPNMFDSRRKLDLRFTDLRGLEFYDAQLPWTDFYGAHLEGAQLWGAVLRHAKLDHAHLAGANLRGAKLEGASLDGAVLTKAIFDEETVWPTGFDASAHGAVGV